MRVADGLVAAIEADGKRHPSAAIWWLTVVPLAAAAGAADVVES